MMGQKPKPVEKAPVEHEPDFVKVDEEKKEKVEVHKNPKVL